MTALEMSGADAVMIVAARRQAVVAVRSGAVSKPESPNPRHRCGNSSNISVTL